MKSTIFVPEDKPVEYPMLMESTIKPNLVVLMTSYKNGVVIVSDGFHKLGEYRSDWIVGNFQPTNKQIILEN